MKKTNVRQLVTLEVSIETRIDEIIARTEEIEGLQKMDKYKGSEMLKKESDKLDVEFATLITQLAHLKKDIKEVEEKTDYLNTEIQMGLDNVEFTPEQLATYGGIIAVLKR